MITDVTVKEAGDKGKGVFALRSFRKGEFIFRRRHGRVVQNRYIGLLSEEDQRHLCELDWETSAVLLTPGCYINHSCDPNAMRKGVAVYAWRDIDESEGITVDYRLNAFSGEDCLCSCGSPSCRGHFTLSFLRSAKTCSACICPTRPGLFAWSTGGVAATLTC